MDSEELASSYFTRVEQETALYALKKLGLWSQETEGSLSNLQMAQVLVRTLRLFVARNAEHQDLWREGGWPDQRLHIHSKSRRLVTETEGLVGTKFPPKAFDSVYDLIVYCAMLIINAYAGNDGESRLNKMLYGFSDGHSISMDSPITAKECQEMIENALQELSIAIQ